MRELTVLSVAVSEVGHVRTHNEDAVFADDELGLWLVADGMGGHAAGEVASRLAIDTIVADIRAGEGLAVAVQRAHLAIRAAARENLAQHGMGTTLAAVRQCANEFQLVWSGDSRIYSWCRGGDLQQLSRDHSFVADMVARGVLCEEEAQLSQEKNLITQALGMSNIPHLRPGTLNIPAQLPGGLMLCSDGVSDMLTRDTMAEVLCSEKPLIDKAAALTSAVESSEALDNYSFVLLEITPSKRRGYFGRWLNK